MEKKEAKKIIEETITCLKLTDEDKPFSPFFYKFHKENRNLIINLKKLKQWIKKGGD